MTFYQETKSLGTFKILCEALKLPTKNFTLILPIIILSFLSSLEFTNLAPKSIVKASVDPKSLENAKLPDITLEMLKKILGIKVILLNVFSFIVSSLLAIATIHAFTLIHSGKLSTHRDLFHRFVRGWKRPMITKLYTVLFNLGYILLQVALILFLVLMGDHVSMLLGALGIILALFIDSLVYLYLSMLWSVSIVVSVVEDGYYGLEAISKAGEMMRRRRKQGAMLVCIQSVVSLMVYSVYDHVKSSAPPSMVSQVVVGLAYTVVAGVVMMMFELAVSMVFYCNCKRSNSVEGTATEEGFMYSRVLTTAYGEVEFP